MSAQAIGAFNILLTFAAEVMIYDDFDWGLPPPMTYASANQVTPTTIELEVADELVTPGQMITVPANSLWVVGDPSEQSICPTTIEID